MILLTGANGQLGTDFKKLFTQNEIDFCATDYDELDITNKSDIRKYVNDKDISCIINCAAYNDVDKAESDKDNAYLLNSIAVSHLVEIANEIGADFVTYSTDFIFDGNKKSPYLEEDEPNPISVYANSKYQGEKVVLTNYDKAFIIRTSWVFGMGNNNFNKQVIKWSENNKVLKIVDDQVSSATYSWDLAFYSWELIKTKKYGLYHLSNSGECSKYDQAKFVLDSIGWKGTLHPTKTSTFNLPAYRSKYSKLSTNKLEKTIGMSIPSWQDGIKRFLDEFIKENESL